MEGSSTKLTFLLLIVATASVLVPLEAEARCKEHKRPRGHHHHHHHHHHPHPRPHPYPPTLPPSPPPVPLSPAPTPAPSGIPPYQIHGCGYPCSDSNDCDWPCTMCCYQNQTCCNDESIPPPQVIQEPASAPIVADAPEDVPSTYPPYQMHGCGYPCNDSNDCDWPCTMCCYHSERNQTCC